MDQSIETLEEQFKEDALIVEYAIEQIKVDKLRISQLANYNENLKSTFDAEVQKTAMKILDSSATGMNDGGGSLVYNRN